MPEVKLPKLIKVSPGTLEVDGVDFPLAIGEAGAMIVVRNGKVPSVTVELVAERVEVENEVERDTGLLKPKAEVLH